MATFTSRNVAATEGLGEQLGRLAAPGWVFGLTGDLGAGKTAFTRGVARALGVTARVQSPTFALVRQYPGRRCPLVHLDLYRLESTDQIHGAGLDEYLDPSDAVTVVEWFERWTGPAPSRLCSVRFEPLGEDVRLIHYDPPRP